MNFYIRKMDEKCSKLVGCSNFPKYFYIKIDIAYD
jgi:hypothetical protein